MLLPLVLGVALAVANLDRHRQPARDGLALHDLPAERRRLGVPRPAARPARPPGEHLEAPGRRLRGRAAAGALHPRRARLARRAASGAFAVDSLLGAFASIFVMIPLLGLDEDVGNTLWWFVGDAARVRRRDRAVHAARGRARRADARQAAVRPARGVRPPRQRQRRAAPPGASCCQGAVLDRLGLAAVPARDRQRRVHDLRPRTPRRPGPRHRHASCAPPACP